MKGLLCIHNRGKLCSAYQASRQGFTIVEVLIVLAVTGALFVSAAATISGRQNATQFQQAVNDVQTRMQKIINDVGSGQYANNGDISCTKTASGDIRLEISATQINQGTNKECIFLGRAVQFFSDPDTGTEFNAYTIAGLRGTTAQPNTTLADTHPRLVAQGATGPQNVPDVFDPNPLLYGLAVASMYFNKDSTKTIGALAFISSLGSLNDDDASQQVDLLAIGGTSLADTKKDGVDSINSNLVTGSTLNPNKGVQICFQSGGTDQWALMTIGGAGRQLSVKMNITDTDCA